MPLALKVDKLDTVPEAQRGLYVEKDGAFHLDVDGVPDVTGLKSALDSERAANKEHAKNLAAWKKLGKTPEEIAEMTAAAQTAAEDALKKAGKHDEILAAKLAAAEKVRTESEAKLTGQRDSALGLARAAVVGAAINTALTKAKATGEGLDLLGERLGKRVKLEFGDDGKHTISILDAAGGAMIGSAKDGTATYDDLVKEATKIWPSLFEADGKGGSGARQPGTGGSGKTMSRADFAKLSAAEQKQKVLVEKVKIVD